jgi:hypothetical protein
MIIPYTDGNEKTYAPTLSRPWRLHFPLAFPCTSTTCVICTCSECCRPLGVGRHEHT